MVDEKIKRTYIGAEVDDDIIEQIKTRYLDTGEYPNMSEFLRKIITEKLDPGKSERFASFNIPKYSSTEYTDQYGEW